MMRKLFLFMVALFLIFLAACGNNNNNDSEDSEELKALDVEFEIPKTAKKGEKILLKATVTYGDELVDDADEVNFEYWEEGREDESTTIESINNENGTYTAEIVIENEGIFSIYAHTTARGLHTMPLKSVTVEN